MAVTAPVGLGRLARPARSHCKVAIAFGRVRIAFGFSCKVGRPACFVRSLDQQSSWLYMMGCILPRAASAKTSLDSTLGRTSAVRSATPNLPPRPHLRKSAFGQHALRWLKFGSATPNLPRAASAKISLESTHGQTSAVRSAAPNLPPAASAKIGLRAARGRSPELVLGHTQPSPGRICENQLGFDARSDECSSLGHTQPSPSRICEDRPSGSMRSDG